MKLRGKCAVSGYGETPFAKARDAVGRSNLSEQCEAAAAAIADAGMGKDAIDGLISIAPIGEPLSWSMDLAEYLQLDLRFLDNVYHGGGSGTAALLHAAAAIDAGLCETVLLVGGSAYDAARYREFGLKGDVSYSRDFDTIYGPMLDNSAYALIKRRYMSEFGASEEAFARIVVNARYHAARFPNALLKTEIQEEEVLASPIICDPLRIFEIVMPCTGACALVVTSAERARDGRNRPVYLLGGGQRIDRGMRSPAYGRNPSLTTSPIKAAADDAFKMAELTIGDMAFAQLYDCYTVTVVIALEDIGLCAKGEGAEFILSTDLRHGGDFPVNTDGGQLGRGQPYGACHFLHTVEAVRQLSGRAGDLQVADATFGLVNGNGGSMANECTLILGNDIP